MTQKSDAINRFFGGAVARATDGGGSRSASNAPQLDSGLAGDSLQMRTRDGDKKSRRFHGEHVSGGKNLLLSASILLSMAGRAVARGSAGLTPAPMPAWSPTEAFAPAPAPQNAPEWSSAGLAPSGLPPANFVDLTGPQSDYGAIGALLQTDLSRPLIVSDSLGSYFFVRGSHNDSGKTLLDFSNVEFLDVITPARLDFFINYTQGTLATQQGARGLPLGSGPGGSNFTFEYFAADKDPATAQQEDDGSIEAYVRGADGVVRQLTVEDFSAAFPNGAKQIFDAALGLTGNTANAANGVAALRAVAAAPAPPPAIMSQPAALEVGYAGRPKVELWLGSQASNPAFAYDSDGKPFFVRIDADSIMLLSADNPGERLVLGMNDAVDRLRYLDSAAQGSGVQLLDPDASGQAFVYRGLSNAADTIEVLLAGAQGDRNMTLSAFQGKFGTRGMTALVTSILSEPSFNEQFTLAPPPDNAVLFSNVTGATGPQLVGQGTGVGDCYFDAVVASILEENPAYLQSLVTPSDDGVVGHIDIRLYDPTLTVTSPYVFTATNKLPVDGQADAVETDPDGTPEYGVPMLEKGYVLANRQYDWHNLAKLAGASGDYDTNDFSAISTGDPFSAMQMLTGLPAADTDFSTLPDDKLWAGLSSVSDGKLVVVGVTSPLLPGGFSLPGIFSGHAYTVLDVRQDGGEGRSVQLRNPWQGGVPDGQGGIDFSFETDGRFWLTFADCRKAFDVLSEGDLPANDK